MERITEDLDEQLSDLRMNVGMDMDPIMPRMAINLAPDSSKSLTTRASTVAALASYQSGGIGARTESRSVKLENIRYYRKSLLQAGQSLDDIAEVTVTSTDQEINDTLEILQIRNARIEYATFLEELLLILAKGMEIFDGTKPIPFTSIYPNMKGYGPQLKVKLQRLQPEMSGVVGQFVGNRKMNPWSALAMGIVPGIVLHAITNSNSKKTTSGGGGLASRRQQALEVASSIRAEEIRNTEK